MEMVEMPALGETVQEGKILCWMKLVGDSVQLDDSLAALFTNGEAREGAKRITCNVTALD